MALVKANRQNAAKNSRSKESSNYELCTKNEAELNIVNHTLFAEHYSSDLSLEVGDPDSNTMADDVQVAITKDIARDQKSWEEKQYQRIGSVEFVAKGNLSLGAAARTQASLVGATLVLFSLWPAKLRSIRRKEDGSIDIDAVVADPPAGLSPRGYYVLRAVFMRPKLLTVAEQQTLAINACTD